jgi:sortase A
LAAQHKAGRTLAKNTIRVVRWFLLGAGAVLIGIYMVAQIHTEVMSRVALRQFSQAAQAKSPAGRSAGAISGAGHGIDFGLWSMKRITAYEQSVANQFVPPLAVLGIPSIGLEVPVFDGTDEITLNRGVGRIVGTAKPGRGGNVGIAGHRDGFFRGLKDMKVGDSLELELTDRNEVYRVDQIQIVKPDDVQVLGKRDVPTLTLVTCYPFYYIGNAPQRFIVQASLLTGSPKERQALSPVQ